VTRPRVDALATNLVAGEPATITGSGFMHLPQPGATNNVLLDLLPRVAFVPASSLAPLAARVSSWSDQSIQFIAPATPYHGGGWLFVIVEGVPSQGQWVVLDPARQGKACTLDGDCATGHCAERVCCDQACEDGCVSCLGSVNGTGVDGSCRAIPRDDKARFGCNFNANNACSSDGTCDGEGDCKYPPSGTPCSSPAGGTCVKGNCVGRCASTLDCAAGLLCLPNGTCGPPGNQGPDAPACAASGATRSAGPGVAGVVVAWLVALALRRRGRPPGSGRARRTFGS
jgi:hypothetical protein